MRFTIHITIILFASLAYTKQFITTDAYFIVLGVSTLTTIGLGFYEVKQKEREQ